MTEAGPWPRIAVLDDYQGVALGMADWSAVQARATVEVFADTISDPDALVARLLPFDALCVMRERTPLPRAVITRLPRLKLIVSTGARNASIDQEAAAAHGIAIQHTRGSPAAPVELTWALIQASARNLVAEANALRAGAWQQAVGDELHGRTLGILGMGRIGAKVAGIAKLFGMEVITWSSRGTQDAAAKAGATSVTKEQLFSQSDILSVHLVLVDATRGLVGAGELAQMKRTAWLVNTARGPVVDEAALVAALQGQMIAGAALDVFGTEPLPAHHPFRTLPNVLATPHLGYVSRQQYELFYGDTVRHVTAWLDGRQGGA